MTDNLTLIDRKIRKLQQLRDLLADPEIAEFVQTMFAKSAPAKFQATQLVLPKPRRKYERRGGSLVDKTYKSLREFGEPTTAKELAEFMKSGGYKFKAKDPNIAVSKALRQLADIQKISSRRGEHAKAPIVYWIADVIDTGEIDRIPVQEEMRH